MNSIARGKLRNHAGYGVKEQKRNRFKRSATHACIK